MGTYKKLLKKSDIKTCKDFAFGYTRFFKNYDIISDNYDIYLVGKNQINKKDLFMTINKSEFLKECKKIGRELCDLLFNKLNKHFEIIHNNFEIIHNNFDNVINIEPYLINFECVNENRNKIIGIINSFIHNYGIPVNNELQYSLYTKTTITNIISLREICTYFILINIISDLAFFSKRGIKIDIYYNLFNFDKTDNNENIVSKLFNIELLHNKHVGEYYIKYIDSDPICYTPNLFTFAFEQLKYSIIKRKNNINISVEINHNHKKIPKSKKELSKNTSATYYINQKNDYKRLVTYLNTIKKYDVNHEYTDLINKLSEVKKIKDIRRNIHTPLINEAYYITIKLKNTKQNRQ